MKLSLLLFLLTGVGCVFGQRLPDDFNPERAEREGRELTAELLSRVPTENYTNSGVLEIKRRGSDPIEFPIRFTVRVSAGYWISSYEAVPDANTNAVLASLFIVNAPGRPSRYYRGSPEDLEQAKPLTASEVATTKFGGSDFWICDLGLEFLHWPVQRLLKKELRRGQSCDVLESINTNAAPGQYARVVSWIDIDTGGIVFAESYDSKRKRIKEFAPKSFKKVDGEWELEEMRIEDLREKSKTTIVFDLRKE